jgi:hypothetical protein
MGRGSATLNRVLTDNKVQRSTWTERDLLKAAQVMGSGTGPTKTFILDQSCERKLVPLRQVGELEGIVAQATAGARL